jgi:ABC-type transport system substrate-binding protein
MRAMTIRRTASMVRVGVMVVTILGDGAWAHAHAARPTQWTVVVSEKTGVADALSEYGTNAQFYRMPHVVEPLVRIELQAGERSWGVVPVLAEKWSFPDPRTFVVEVKRGVKFQNGEELTAEHVKAAFDAFVSPEKPGRRGVVLKGLGKADVVGKHTVKWSLPKPPPIAVKDVRRATIALATSGGIVPKGNPDRIESTYATKWAKYSLIGVDDLTPEGWQSVHGGYDTTRANEDPDRIIPGKAITHPLGDPTLSRDEEKALRRRLIRRALDALQPEIQSPTVFR